LSNCLATSQRQSIFLFKNYRCGKKYLENVEDTKGLNRSRRSKNRQYNGKENRIKRQTMIYKTLHLKLGVNSGAPKW
jgi:hypothetical protein